MKKYGLISLSTGFFFGLILFFVPGLIPTIGKWVESLSQPLSLYFSSFVVAYLVFSLLFILGGYVLHLVISFILVKIFSNQERIPFQKTLPFFAGIGNALLLFLVAAFIATSRFKGF